MMSLSSEAVYEMYVVESESWIRVDVDGAYEVAVGQKTVCLVRATVDKPACQGLAGLGALTVPSTTRKRPRSLTLISEAGSSSSKRVASGRSTQRPSSPSPTSLPLSNDAPVQPPDELTTGSEMCPRFTRIMPFRRAWAMIDEVEDLRVRTGRSLERLLADDSDIPLSIRCGSTLYNQVFKEIGMGNPHVWMPFFHSGRTFADYKAYVQIAGLIAEPEFLPWTRRGGGRMGWKMPTAEGEQSISESLHGYEESNHCCLLRICCGGGIFGCSYVCKCRGCF